MIEKYAKPGISVNMLFPETLVNEEAHVAAVKACCVLENYEVLDVFLPEDSVIRQDVLKLLSESGKQINYNAPPAYQDPKYDAGSSDQNIRNSTLDLVKRHIDFAAQTGSKIFVLPSCRDTGGVRERAVRKENFKDFLCRAAVFAEEFGITMVLEPIERHRFKKMLLGPTFECVQFIKDMQKKGCDNVQLMIDTAHLPLMEEEFNKAIIQSSTVDLWHVHLGNAVLDQNSELYGHMHAPLGLPGGAFGFDDLVDQMSGFIAVGYIHTDGERRSTLSYEIRPYPGVSPRTTAQAAFEMLDNAFAVALERKK